MKQMAIVPRIRNAEAQVKALQKLLEQETGVTELEGLLLDQLSKMQWTNHVELHGMEIGWGWVRSSSAVNGLKRKLLIDYEHGNGKPIRFRINTFGRKALERFKKELRDK